MLLNAFQPANWGKDIEAPRSEEAKFVFQWFAVPKWGTVPRVAFVYNTQGFVPKRADFATLRWNRFCKTWVSCTFVCRLCWPRPTWIMVYHGHHGHVFLPWMSSTVDGLRLNSREANHSLALWAYQTFVTTTYFAREHICIAMKPLHRASRKWLSSFGAGATY